VSLQQRAGVLEFGFGVGAPQAVGANFDEALGQHVTQEALDE
jgi:hypothetical protein